MTKAIVKIPNEILQKLNFFKGPSCGNFIFPNKYKAIPMPIITHKPINSSRFKSPQCSTKSAFDKNFNAKANSINPKTTLTVFNQPPDFGNEFNHLGNMANNVNGKANARPKPLIPKVNWVAPPSTDKELPNNVPNIGPV